MWQEGKTPFDVASYCGNSDIASLAASNEKLLLDAVALGRMESAQKALQAGANVNCRDMVKLTSLMHKIRGNTAYEIQFFGQAKRKPLHLAAQKGDSVMATLLINHGADVNTFDNVRDPSSEDSVHNMIVSCPMLKERDSPLHLAAEEGNIDVAKLLVKSGADVKALNAVTPSYSKLLIACLAKHTLPSHTAMRTLRPHHHVTPSCHIAPRSTTS